MRMLKACQAVQTISDTKIGTKKEDETSHIIVVILLISTSVYFFSFLRLSERFFDMCLIFALSCIFIPVQR